MDIKNILLTSFNGIKNFVKTSGDRVLDKKDGFYYDTKISAIENALVDLYKKVSIFDVTGISHNGIFRGKSLGNTVTDTQYNTIEAGLFEDLYIGDYWNINGIIWRIAAFDYWFNTGLSGEICSKHHVVIVPDALNISAKMNETTQETTGAYAGCDFYTGANGNTGKADAIAAVESAFGSTHILAHSEAFPKTIDANGVPSSRAWYTATVDLMSEHMVIGGKMFETGTNGTVIPYIHSLDRSILPLFALAPQYVANRQNWWLRTVASKVSYSRINVEGVVSEDYANNNSSIRPVFAICKSNS